MCFVGEGSLAGPLARAGSIGRRLRLGDAVVVVLVAMNLVYGLLNASDYGQSWDDPLEAKYGVAALNAYRGSTGYLTPEDPYTKNSGPFYFMVAGGLSAALHSISPATDAVDVRHFLNFLCFQLAVLAVYGIARRILEPGPALLTVLVFTYQPVLFGHAFINQKDIPLLAGFTGAVFLGLKIGDRAKSIQGNELEAVDLSSGFLRSFALGWRSLSLAGRGLFLLLALAGLAISADLLFGDGIQAWANAVLASVYRGEAWRPLTTAFSWVAQDAYKTPLEAYSAKLDRMFGWIRIVGVYLALLPLALMIFIIARRNTKRDFGIRHVLTAVIPAAVVLGLTISIRAVGVFAGVLVTTAVLVMRGRQGLGPLFLYWVVALSVSYLTWPYLWGPAVGRFVESIRLMADFPSHLVLFRGLTISSTNLPWDYLPTLLGIQLTEPVLILLGIGLVALPSALRRYPGHRLLLALLFVWFFLPFAASLFFRVPLYSNFRQVLFSLPPLFLLAGIGIDLLWNRARGLLPKAALVIAILLPGLAGIGRLRPYEYIYYNSLVGGENGAEGKFAHDYWCTSYREAMAFVNLHAPVGARVAISEQFAVAAPFARPDLVPVRGRNDPRAYYVLRCNNRGDLTLRNLQGFPLAFAVTRSGVV